METVCVYTFDTLADWEIGHALAHLRTPRWQRTPGAFDIQLVGNTMDPITTETMAD